MYNPVSTYRIQFHKDFTFAHLEEIIPYLEKLGVCTIYASPIFKSVPGSLHGYDGVDPLQINPEIGSLDELRAISRKLKAKGIGWVQDIVPNHMAFHSDNTWLMDVLEHGKKSPYFNFFDIMAEPLMVPFLGSTLQEVIANGELKIIWSGGKLCFDYAGNVWPLNLASYSGILNCNPLKQPKTLNGLLTEIYAAQNLTDPASYAEATVELTGKISRLGDAKSGEWLGKTLAKVNTDRALLAAIAGQQYYRLCKWQETDTKINYRRFFTVNGLICLNIQRPEVFSAFHQLIDRLVKEQVFDGLRIDHIDGLYDPKKYLNQLRALVGPETFIAVEKILEPGEAMASDWPVQGSTGYDFLALVNNLLTNREGELKLGETYRALTGEANDMAIQVAAKKRAILTGAMAGEWENLTRLFIDLKLCSQKELQQVPYARLKAVIGEFLIACPVYRYYANTWPLTKRDHKAVNEILGRVAAANPDLKKAVDLLRKSLLEHKSGDRAGTVALQFIQRCMQFTGPLMAKGVEDTLMYTDSHFIAHNEVGDSPDARGLAVKQFHRAMLERQKTWPLSLNGTATHDTKRGEDVRARLQVLPDIPDQWHALVDQWQASMTGGEADDIAINDAYLIYQTLLAAYPMPGSETQDFKPRLEAYIEKALREGKEHSDWAEPDVAYETTAKALATSLLYNSRPAWRNFHALHDKIAGFGVINSLAQVILKFTCPGVPDVYQGCEHWDFSLVDPDNRRPVDYGLRNAILAKVQGITGKAALPELWKQRLDGSIKVWLTQTLAAERRQFPVLFEKGAYRPLKVKGKYKGHIIAFARCDLQQWYVSIVPVGMAALLENAEDLLIFDWGNTRILLPADAPVLVADVLGDSVLTGGKEIAVSQVFSVSPVGLLKLTMPASQRSAGILLPLASLPSPFGIGDLGPGAMAFAGLLHECGQNYWQMLPLNPVSARQQFSPYSSYASFAGNEWYVSPELLSAEGLLSAGDIAELHLPSVGEIDYQQAANIKRALLDKAWENYKKGQGNHLEAEFRGFRQKESYWLNDYALFVALKTQHGDEPWHQWPHEYKFRDQRSLARFSRRYTDKLQKSKWLQFIFTRQLGKLKAYSNKLGIGLFGDLPFYVGYDSADVWANPELFCLDEDGGMTEVAGVPPDYFNSNGQLWGMPVYNWDRLKQQHFGWWTARIRKNLEYFDLLRLDHFRAFASYWAVPAHEETAINGRWLPAPGADLFKVLQDQIGELPLVAEDLGDIDDAVQELRDQFQLPGMKVLQFAWGAETPVSPHVPHNYTENFVAYTGTHDNNTTRGWYNADADKKVRKSIRRYFGRKIKNGEVTPIFIRTVLASTARTVIVPLQDWLNLGNEARLNTPAGENNNWVWRVSPRQLSGLPILKILKWVARYNR